MNDIKTQDNWSSCPLGIISEMVAKKHARRSVVRRTRLALGTSTVLAFVLLGVALHSWVDQTPIAAITCQQAQMLMADFQTGSLEPALEQRIRIHLRNCPGCHRKYEAAGALANVHEIHAGPDNGLLVAVNWPP